MICEFFYILVPFCRFSTAEQAAKNRIQNPCKVLHYYNAPLDFDEEKMIEVCNLLSYYRYLLWVCKSCISSV